MADNRDSVSFQSKKIRSHTFRLLSFLLFKIILILFGDLISRAFRFQRGNGKFCLFEMESILQTRLHATRCAVVLP